MRKKDLTKFYLEGKVFGRLTVLECMSPDRDSHKNYARLKWKCKCTCGKEKVVLGYNLLTGMCKSCGCSRFEGRRLSLEGKTYGSLVVQHYIPYKGWLCICSKCGKEVIRTSHYLITHDDLDCGHHGDKKKDIKLRKDYTGITYDGEWTVLHRDTEYKGYKVKYVCENKKGERKSVFSTFISSYLKEKKQKEERGNLKLEGMQFGKLTVLHKVDFADKDRVFVIKKFNDVEVKHYFTKAKDDQYLCQCECGNQTIVTSSRLFTGSAKSCGCDSEKAKFFVKKGKKYPVFVVHQGDRFGRLVVLHPVKEGLRAENTWLCQCDCGKQKEIKEWCLRAGTKSCGCLKKKENRGMFSVKESKKKK